MIPAYLDKITESDGTEWVVKQIKKWRKAFTGDDHSLFFAVGTAEVTYVQNGQGPATVTAMISDSPSVVESFPGLDSGHRSGMARFAAIHIQDPDDSTQAYTLGCVSDQRGAF